MADQDRSESSGAASDRGDSGQEETADDTGRQETGGEGLDDSELRISNYSEERSAAKERLAKAWRCRLIEAEGYSFDWFAVRSDQPSALINYRQHTEKGNVLLPAKEWHDLRTYSLFFLIPHFWVMDFFAEGLRYKMYPPSTGLRHETIVIGDRVYITIAQNDFDILKEA